MDDIEITYKGITYIREEYIISVPNNNFSIITYWRKQDNIYDNFNISGLICDDELEKKLEIIYQRKTKLKNIFKNGN